MMKRFVGYALTLLVGAGVGASEVEAQLEWSGSVDFYYQYYLNKSDAEGMRTFDLQHNSFTLGLAEIAVERAPTASSRVGGRVDLNFGPVADLTSIFEPDPSYGDGPEIFRNLQQAYISVMANDQVTIDFGKFVTPLGAEVIESQSNMNYSRSVLFGYVIPFYHAGLRVGLAASEQLTLTGYVVNGWNNVTDNNSDKTFIASAALTPNEQMTWYGNIIVGKEGDFGGDPAEQDLLWVFDTTLSFAATEAFTLMANLDFGSAADAAGTPADPEAATFWGIAGYGRFQSSESWALAGRFEFIDNPDGFLSLDERSQSFTITSDHRLFGDLITRIEGRIDMLENEFFTDADGDPTDSQPSITVGMVYELN
jgi:hypothetical protein